MGDCAGFEHAFSYTVAQFWGSILSTAIVCIALLIYDWRMGLALLWERLSPSPSSFCPASCR